MLMKKQRLCRAAALCLSVLLLLPALSGCKKEKYPMRSSTVKESTTVFTLGTVEVPFEVLHTFFTAAALASPGYGEGYFDGDGGEERFTACLGTALSRIADVYALFALAGEAGIDPYGEEITKAVQDMVTLSVDGGTDEEGNVYQGFGGDYNAYLDHQRKVLHMNDSVSRLIFRYAETEKRLIAHHRENAGVTDAEVAAFFNGEDCLHIEWLHQTVREGVDARRLLETAREKLLEKGVNGGELPADVMAQYSDLSGTSAIDPTGFYISPRSLESKYASVAEAAFSLPVGGLSEVIEANGGYFLVYRMEKKPEDLTGRAQEIKALCLTDRFYGEVSARSAELLSGATYTEAFHTLTAAELLED